MTIDSPWTLGSVTTRRSMCLPSIVQADAAVLRHAPLGDVEVAHDLHAADRAGDHPLGDRRRLLEHAVDAEAHAQLLAVGRQVHVRGADLDRLGDDLVDELDDRRLVAALAQLDDLGAPLSSSSSTASWTTSSRRVRRLISCAMSSRVATAGRTS